MGMKNLPQANLSKFVSLNRLTITQYKLLNTFFILSVHGLKSFMAPRNLGHT